MSSSVSGKFDASKSLASSTTTTGPMPPPYALRRGSLPSPMAVATPPGVRPCTASHITACSTVVKDMNAAVGRAQKALEKATRYQEEQLAQQRLMDEKKQNLLLQQQQQQQASLALKEKEQLAAAAAAAAGSASEGNGTAPTPLSGNAGGQPKSSTVPFTTPGAAPSHAIPASAAAAAMLSPKPPRPPTGGGGEQHPGASPRHVPSSAARRPMTSPRIASRTKSIAEDVSATGAGGGGVATDEPCALFVRVYSKQMQEWKEAERDVQAIRDTWSGEGGASASAATGGGGGGMDATGSAGPSSSSSAAAAAGGGQAPLPHLASKRTADAGGAAAPLAPAGSPRLQRYAQQRPATAQNPACMAAELRALEERAAEAGGPTAVVQSRADVDLLARQALLKNRLDQGASPTGVLLVAPQARIAAVLDVYRHNVNAAQTFLRQRVHDLRAERDSSQKSSGRRERLDHAIHQAIETYMREFNVASEADVPINVVKNARHVLSRELEMERCRKVSMEEVRERNRRREAAHHVLLAKVEQERREHIDRAIRRHDELVQVAQERRDVELEAESAKQWTTSCVVAVVSRRMQRNFLILRSLIQLNSVYTCVVTYFHKLLAPAKASVKRKKRRRMKGRFIFALVAARFAAWLIHRRKCVSLIVQFNNHVRRANVVKLAIRTFTTRFKKLQKCVRAYLAFRKMRVGVLLQQWGVYEDTLRTKLLEKAKAAHALKHHAAAAALDNSPGRSNSIVGGGAKGGGLKGSVTVFPAGGAPAGPPPPPAPAAMAPAGRRGKQPVAHVSKQDLMAQKIEQLVADDLTEYNYAVPMQHRLPGASSVWTTLSRHFAIEVEPILHQKDVDRYNVAAQIYASLPAHKRMHMRKPMPVQRRRVPPFCPPLMVAGPCFDTLHEWLMELRRVQRQAAKECILAATEFDYTAVRDKLYIALLEKYAEEHSRRQADNRTRRMSRFSTANELPETARLALSTSWKEALEKSVDGLILTLKDDISAASIASEAKFHALPKGDAFMALLPNLGLLWAVAKYAGSKKRFEEARQKRERNRELD